MCFTIELTWVFTEEFEAQGGLFIEEADPDEARLQDKIEQMGRDRRDDEIRMILVVSIL